MKEVNDLLKDLGVSKVKLAKYLGVSRQMVYNYLEMDSLDTWPKDKKTKLLVLFGVDDESMIKDVKASNDTILRIDEILSDTDNDYGTYSNEYSVKNLNKKNQKLFSDIIEILKERLSDDNNDVSFATFKYLYYFLQVMDDVEELKYVLGYFAKSNGFINVNEFAFDEEKQTMFEGIMFQAVSLFTGGSFSKQKVLDTHKKFEIAVQAKREEELSRTQELYSVKAQALKELGYTEINEKNVSEVFQKIAEIETRKI